METSVGNPRSVLANVLDLRPWVSVLELQLRYINFKLIPLGKVYEPLIT